MRAYKAIQRQVSPRFITSSLGISRSDLERRVLSLKLQRPRVKQLGKLSPDPNRCISPTRDIHSSALRTKLDQPPTRISVDGSFRNAGINEKLINTEHDRSSKLNNRKSLANPARICSKYVLEPIGTQMVVSTETDNFELRLRHFRPARLPLDRFSTGSPPIESHLFAPSAIPSDAW